MITVFLLGLLLQTVTGDSHILDCHTDWLRFYRVQTVETMPNGIKTKTWSRWFLIDDRKPDDKKEIADTLKFYRNNNIKVEYAAIEGKLPE